MHSADEIKRVKATYLPVKKIRLVKMEDAQAPPVGTEETIQGVDDLNY